ncbi:MAG: hypothetical protein WCO00_11120, partial [Rhodospirillaceae bacterium]
ELIGRDRDHYQEIAVALASDTARVAVLRNDLRSRMIASPLCDAPAFARKLEGVYRELFARVQS